MTSTSGEPTAETPYHEPYFVLELPERLLNRNFPAGWVDRLNQEVSDWLELHKIRHQVNVHGHLFRIQSTIVLMSKKDAALFKLTWL
jgi:hypothetical protein